jgi:hypothetical protein
VILAVNIYKRDKPEEGFFFTEGSANGLQEFNLSIWNNSKVHSLTGYRLQDLKHCLVELSEFISNNLAPNRLEGFDISAIMAVPEYDA